MISKEFSFLSWFVLCLFIIMLMITMTVISWYRNTVYTMDTVSINYWKLSQNVITATKTLYINTICRHLIKKCISKPCLHGDVITKAKELNSDTSKLVKSLKSHIHQGYDLATITYLFYFAKNKNNLLVGTNCN
jgi:hypothetical protein